ncbi:ORF_8 [Adoxophyes orana granulovirus]|uniref:Chitin-binding protein 1 n=1 Tax=Adoxophyes orana granulovirus TaxID=170617 RepID=Q7TA07_GVAO|nr:ORF_8 [Adoxophyes orana granulovirus]AAP85645.1 ORF_8 [Adoxophyes orana granulovirus]AJA91648.1 chitin-binding protein 1 [Adoxophyes orana granulovirus]
MELWTWPTVVFVLFIIVKVMIYHGFKNLQQKKWYIEQICVNGFYGNAPDPFQCDAYYHCPEGVKYFCDIDEQYDADKSMCIKIDNNDYNSCYNIAARRLLYL